MLGNRFISNPADLREILTQIAIVIPSKIFKGSRIARGARDHDSFIGVLRYMANDDMFTVSNDFPSTRTKNVLNEIADVFVAGYVLLHCVIPVLLKVVQMQCKNGAIRKKGVF